MKPDIQMCLPMGNAENAFQADAQAIHRLDVLPQAISESKNILETTSRATEAETKNYVVSKRIYFRFGSSQDPFCRFHQKKEENKKRKKEEAKKSQNIIGSRRIVVGRRQFDELRH